MNFMFHTTLDAVSNILKVHYKSMKCVISFSQGSVFRWSGHVFMCVQNCSSCLQQRKNYKNQTSFSRVMITNVLPRFLWIKSVHDFLPVKHDPLFTDRLRSANHFQHFTHGLLVAEIPFYHMLQSIFNRPISILFYLYVCMNVSIVYV